MAFSRSGGRSLGGVEQVTRTDLGYWMIDYQSVPVNRRDRQKTWNGIAAELGGRAGLIAVPVFTQMSAPYASGKYEPMAQSLHSDDASFDDGSTYIQGAIEIQAYGTTAIGATTMTFRVYAGSMDLAGSLFSYQDALYEIGRISLIDGNRVTARISPSVRAEIPNAASLEFDDPRCLCRLASDGAMGAGNTAGNFEQRNVSFIEATDYWNSLV